jgi:hypothetical protein
VIFGKLKVGDEVKWHFGTETCTGVVKAVKGKTIIVDTGEVILEMKKKELKKI